MASPYDPRKYYDGKKPSPLKTGLLVGRIGIVLKAMVADATEEGSVIIEAGYYKAKALETVSAFDSVIVVAVTNEILHIRKYVVDVDVVSGGAGGGLAQLQIKSIADVWTNVGYYTGNLNVPVEILASVALGRTWTITETVPISNASLAYLANLDVALSTALSTRASETTLSSLLTELLQKLETADLSLEAVTKYLNANVKNFPSEYPLPSAQITSLQTIRLLTASDIVTVTNLLNPHPVSLSTLPSLVAGTANIGDVDVASMPEVGTVIHISKTATGDLITPASGKAIKILGFFFYSTADITVELRFKTSGNVIGGLSTKGACGMNLISMKKPQGSADEVVEVYLSGAGTVKGWISHGEV